MEMDEPKSSTPLPSTNRTFGVHGNNIEQPDKRSLFGRIAISSTDEEKMNAIFITIANLSQNSYDYRRRLFFLYQVLHQLFNDYTILERFNYLDSLSKAEGEPAEALWIQKLIKAYQ